MSVEEEKGRDKKSMHGCTHTHTPTFFAALAGAVFLGAAFLAGAACCRHRVSSRHGCTIKLKKEKQGEKRRRYTVVV